MTDQEVMNAAVDAAQERIRYRDLIRELVGALDEAAYWVPGPSLDLRIEATIAKARKELDDA